MDTVCVAVLDAMRIFEATENTKLESLSSTVSSILPLYQCPTIWMVVGQGPTALPVGAGGSCLDIFILLFLFSPVSPSLWETGRYRLKYS